MCPQLLSNCFCWECVHNFCEIHFLRGVSIASAKLLSYEVCPQPMWDYFLRRYVHSFWEIVFLRTYFFAWPITTILHELWEIFCWKLVPMFTNPVCEWSNVMYPISYGCTLVRTVYVCNNLKMFRKKGSEKTIWFLVSNNIIDILIQKVSC